MAFALACPEGYELEKTFVDALPAESFRMMRDPHEAAAGADVIYTDTWVSMGQEAQRAARAKAFQGYQVNAALLKAAPPHAIVLHCLPAYRDCEISAEVLEAHAESIFTQAENRLHFQRTLLHVLVAEGGVP